MQSNEIIKFQGRMGERIRDVREARRCSQKMLAIRSGISQSHLSKIESGERAASLWNLWKISCALRVSPAYIMRTACVTA